MKWFNIFYDEDRETRLIKSLMSWMYFIIFLLIMTIWLFITFYFKTITLLS